MPVAITPHQRKFLLDAEQLIFPDESLTGNERRMVRRLLEMGLVEYIGQSTVYIDGGYRTTAAGRDAAAAPKKRRQDILWAPTKATLRILRIAVRDGEIDLSEPNLGLRRNDRAIIRSLACSQPEPLPGGPYLSVPPGHPGVYRPTISAWNLVNKGMAR